MCMKYLNTTAACYKSITMDNSSIVSFDAPFRTIRPINDNGTTCVKDFVVVTQIDFIGTNNPEHKLENPLEQRWTVDFIVRLTKCAKPEDERIGYDLGTFSINLDEMYNENLVDTACFGFLNYTRITNVDRLDLPGGPGKYVIKVLAKKSDDKDYTIQSMTQLNIAYF